jgi:hypothetical protein
MCHILSDFSAYLFVNEGSSSCEIVRMIILPVQDINTLNNITLGMLIKVSIIPTSISGKTCYRRVEMVSPVLFIEQQGSDIYMSVNMFSDYKQF